MGKRRPLRTPTNSKVSKSIRIETNTNTNTPPTTNTNRSNRKQQKKRREKGNRKEEEEEEDGKEDSDLEEEDEGSEEEEENFFVKQSNDLISMTFEFNDMKEFYSSGILLMLQFLFLQQEGRTIADIIAKQSEFFSLFLAISHSFLSFFLNLFR